LNKHELKINNQTKKTFPDKNAASIIPKLQSWISDFSTITSQLPVETYLHNVIPEIRHYQGTTVGTKIKKKIINKTKQKQTKQKQNKNQTKTKQNKTNTNININTNKT